MTRFHSGIFVALIGLAALRPAAHAQEGALPVESHLADPGAGMRERLIDQQHLVVRLRFEPEQGRVHGIVTHIFEPLRPHLDSLYLDGPGMDFHEVLLNGRPVAYRVWPEGISIYPGAPLVWQQADTLEITYTATPRHALYFVGWNSPEGRRQIWTQGQGPGHRYWVPLYDTPGDKLISETIITFDEAYEVLSNGERVSVTANGDGTRTWHYRMTAPHAPYLMMIGIGEYGVQEMRSARGVPIYNYFYPDEPDRVTPTYRHTARLMDVLEAQTGVPFPWQRYAQMPVRDFLHGGMENTTATIFSDVYYADARAEPEEGGLTVLAHELAHQWFGDLVTMARNADVWLHESFATYYAKRAERALLGEEHYAWNRKRERDLILVDSTTGPIPIHDTRAGRLVYYKGSLVLDMLRDVVGDEAFDRVIREYLNRHAYESVTSADFYESFERVLGLDLSWFFDQWIERGGEPHYRVSYRPSADAGGAVCTEVTVEQVQPITAVSGLFRMPIGVEVHYADGTHAAARVWVEEQRTAVCLPNPEAAEVSFVLFDPQHRVLKRLTFDRSVQELAAQALHAAHVMDRYDAVAALRAVPVADKRAALTEVFARESSGPVRAEAIRQLAGDAVSEATLRTALFDPHYEVRRAVLENAPTISKALRPGFERALSDSSYRNIATALTRLAEARPSGVREYLRRTRHVIGHDHAVRVAWLEVAARAGRAAASAELIDLAAPSQGFRTRLLAFDALERLDAFDVRAAAYLLEAATHFNRRLSGPASGLVERLLADPDSRSLLRQAYEAGSWAAPQAQALRRWFES